MRRYESRDVRFSARTLLSYAAASLPETLSVVAAAADAPAEILLYDEIGFWGTTASDFAKALLQAGNGPLTLRINSPGGDVFDGYAIYNMLRARTAPVSVVVDGIAASAASFIAMAGTTLTMGEPAMLMIHNCWGLCIGDRNDMLDMAATQEKIDGQMAAIYATKSSKTVADMAAAMNDETWYTSTEAKAAGLCDIVLTAPAAATSTARAAVRIKPTAPPANAAAARAAYDPDGDGDDDAAEAVTLIQDAIGSLADAIEALTGTGGDDAADAAARAAATAAAAAAAAQSDAAKEADAKAAARRRRLALAETEAA